MPDVHLVRYKHWTSFVLLKKKGGNFGYLFFEVIDSLHRLNKYKLRNIKILKTIFKPNI